jgi:hypothetical protein
MIKSEKHEMQVVILLQFWHLLSKSPGTSVAIAVGMKLVKHPIQLEIELQV